jgi:glycosyltransferase involved in cell wall biosynthesis
MSEDPTKFVFMVTAYNAALFARDHLQSICAQSHNNWRVIYVDDASTEGTVQKVSDTVIELKVGERFQLIKNSDRKYKARNVYEALQGSIASDEVVVMLDGDDRLANSEALSVLDRFYREDWHVVWGNWVGSNGIPGTSNYLNPFMSPRYQPFVTSHLFSFRASLFDEVNASELQDDSGKWFEAGCDIAIACSVIERTLRTRFVDEVMCIYNRNNPLSHDKHPDGHSHLVSNQQAMTAKIISGRKPRSPKADDEFIREHISYFLTAMSTASAHREAMLRGAVGAVSEGNSQPKN